MTTTLHAHISTAGSDCDGPVYDGYIERLSVEEIDEHVKANGVNDFHDLHFKARVLDMMVSFHPQDEATVTITCDGFTYSEDTDEGYRAAEVRWCEDDCSDDRFHRDVFAEQMGY